MYQDSDDDSVDRMIIGSSQLEKLNEPSEVTRRPWHKPTSNHLDAWKVAASTKSATEKESSMADSNEFSSGDELEVLPPKRKAKVSRSRLSYSGMDSNDPVTLQSDDEASPQSDSEMDTKPSALVYEKRQRQSDASSSILGQSAVHDDVVEIAAAPPKKQKSGPIQKDAKATGGTISERPLSKYKDTISFSSDSDSEIASRLITIPKARAKPTTTERGRLSLSSETVDLSLSDEDNATAFKQTQSSQPTAGPIGRQLTVGPSRSHLDSSDSDDSDDSLAAMSRKLATKRKAAPIRSVPLGPSGGATQPDKATQRHLDKTERVKAKEAEKLQKQQERERLRQEKEDAKAAAALAKEQKKEAKQADKQTKERQKIECAQASGKLAKNEIAVLMQLDQFPSSKYTVIEDLQTKYLVQDHPSALRCNAVQWIRQDAARGGAAAAVQELHDKIGSRGTSTQTTTYHHFPTVAIVVSDAAGFLKLLERPDRSSKGSEDQFDDDDYPALEQWLKGIEIGWRAAWAIQSRTGAIGERITTKPRLVLLLDRVLETLDKLWIQHRRAASRAAKVPPTAEDVHDAITWILIQFQVECVHCICAEDISTHLLKMTRLLAEIPYRRVVSEVECIQKLRPECFDTDPPEVQAKDCWMRQLQQVPRLSRPIAEHLVHYYPNAQSLYQAYTNPRLTMDEKLMLTANLMGQTTKSKLSAQLYTVLTSTDPNDVLR